MLTPHAGELARLLGRQSADVQAHRLRSAREAASQANAIVVLKGDDTLVARPDGRVAVSPGGSSALATAGTGDVLSGVIGAYLAKGWTRFTPPAPEFTCTPEPGNSPPSASVPEGVIARDVIELLPRALGARS